MDIKSLSLKNILLDDNKEEYFDLSVPSFNVNALEVANVHLVTQDEEGRIDKICQKYYSSTAYIDVLCLINHIYNPFSIKKDDLLLIPHITSQVSQIYAKPEVPIWLSGAEDKSTKNKTNEKDENRTNRLKQQNAPRKANELPEGAQIKKYVNGKIILGTHINTNNG